jgi:hypothetical protein
MPRSPPNAITVLATSLRVRRRRPAVLALLGFLFVAQTALVVHRIDHNNAEHTVACALCVAADHFAVVPGTPVHALVPSPPESVSSVTTMPTIPALIVSYRSRAPPSHLLA